MKIYFNKAGYIICFVILLLVFCVCIYIELPINLFANNDDTKPKYANLQENLTDKIDINKAVKAELECLDGIGPVKAQAIIDYREENGAFTSVQELSNVSGISEKMAQEFEEYIVVSKENGTDE